MNNSFEEAINEYKNKKFIVDGHILEIIEFMFYQLGKEQTDKNLWVQLGKLAEAYFNGNYIKEIRDEN